MPVFNFCLFFSLFFILAWLALFDLAKHLQPMPALITIKL